MHRKLDYEIIFSDPG